MTVAGLIVPGGWARAQDVRPIGRVAVVEGAVQVLRGGDPLPLARGAPVFQADRVRTGRRGGVRIECFVGLTIIIGPQSEATIAHYLEREDQGLEAALSLLYGILRLVGETIGSPWDVVVQTPQAVAAVRSTDWIVEVTPRGTAVFARRGVVVAASRAGGTVRLEPGEGTDIFLGEPPTAPVRWGAARVARVRALTDL